MKKSIAALLSLLLTVSVFFAGCDFGPGEDEETTEEDVSVTETTEEETTAAAGPLSSSEIYKKAAAFTYEISTDTGTGTGFAISKDGWIVTNYHVIRGATRISVESLNGVAENVDQIVAFDREMDLAILKIPEVENWATLNKEAVETGERIYTLGSSEGLTGTFSDGVISRKSREIAGKSVRFIQISAPISHGNSGGPLLNEKAK